MSSFARVGNDCVINILSFLPQQDLENSTRVNKLWNQLANENGLRIFQSQEEIFGYIRLSTSNGYIRKNVGPSVDFFFSFDPFNLLFFGRNNIDIPLKAFYTKSGKLSTTGDNIHIVAKGKRYVFKCINCWHQECRSGNKIPFGEALQLRINTSIEVGYITQAVVDVQAEVAKEKQEPIVIEKFPEARKPSQAKQ